MKKKSTWYRHSFVWVTLVLFLGSLIGHWIFGWFAFVNEQQAHNQPIELGDYFVEMARGTPVRS